MPEFVFNEIYEPVFTTNCRYIDVWGGRARGGSYFGTDYFLFLITQPRYFRGYFIRQVLNDIKDSLFQDIIDRITENPTLNIEDFQINNNSYTLVYKPTGNKILSKGVTGDGKRTAKLKSLAKATHVLIEEANELSKQDFDQLDLSLRTIEAEKIQIIRLFNPPSKNHWIWEQYNFIETDLIDSQGKRWLTAEPKSDSNILSIHSTYIDNIENVDKSTVRKFEDYNRSSNPLDQDYYNSVVLGLISEGSFGKIYSGWNIIQDKEFEELEYTTYYALDFGYSEDPNALLAIKHHGEHIYIKELLYLKGLDNQMLAQKMRDLGISTDDLIIADYGGGGDLRIAELRRDIWKDPNYPKLYFNIRSCVKGAGSIKAGISKVKSFKIFYTESSNNIKFEYQEYKWALDAEKKPTDNPEDKNNHLMDALRYFALYMDRI